MEITRSQLATLAIIRDKMNSISRQIGIVYSASFEINPSEVGAIVIRWSNELGQSGTFNVGVFLDADDIDRSLIDAQQTVDDMIEGWEQTIEALEGTHYSNHSQEDKIND